jgi:drug/metabolite transporter (DMT)-like permease
MRRLLEQDTAMQSAFWMLISCVALSFLAAMGRLLGQYEVNAFQTVFCRLFFAFLVMLPLVLHAGIGSIATTQLKTYFIRSLSGIIAMWTWFYAVTLIPIGEQTALSFLAPLFTTMGAALVLGETVRMRRWLAIAVGFIGALVIIRPGIIEISLGHGMAIFTALAMGCSALIIKYLTRRDNPLVIVFISHLIMMPMALVPAVFVWEWPNWQVWLILMGTGPAAVIGHITMTKAYKLADASFVAGVDYARLPFAVLFGWLFFGELSDLWTWVGASIIFASSFYVIRREMRDLKQAATRDPRLVEKG